MTDVEQTLLSAAFDSDLLDPFDAAAYLVGLGRESLYTTLSTGAHPRFETIDSVLHALGVKFAVVAERER